MTQPYVLQLPSGVYLGTQERPRVALIEDALQFSSKSEAEERAEQMRGTGLFTLPWLAVPAAPVMDPCELIANVRACLPDGKPTNETELRMLTPHMDAVRHEADRANSRRCEGEVAA